jgi:hypothetical protein
VLAFRKIFLNDPIMGAHAPLFLLGMALLVGGIQFFTMGLLGEMLARTYYESQDKPIYSVREVKSRRKEMSDPADPPRSTGSADS